MFLKYLEPLFKPWRALRNSIMRARTFKGNINADVGRVKRFGNVAQSHVKKAQGQVKKAQGQAKQAQGQAQKLQGQAQKAQGQMQQMHQPAGVPAPAGKVNPQLAGGRGKGGPMSPGIMPTGQLPPSPAAPLPGMAPGSIDPNPPIKIVGLFRRRKICTQCETELDKSWDRCPYCAQAAAQAAQVPQKTQAFQIGSAGSSGGQLLGWIVPLEGAQRGELYNLAPHAVVGTDPMCQVVLSDQFMSSQHAEFQAHGGNWVLRDLGSTNGTYVNDQRVTEQELVDNDFIRFGQCVVKFKCL